MSRILIVEDEHAIAKLLGLVLKNAGFETAQAYDEKDFRREALAFKPQAILLDLMLGKDNGLQIYEDLLKEGMAPVPVFILSAALQGASGVTGASGIKYPAMGKPFDNKELIRILKSLFTAKDNC